MPPKFIPAAWTSLLNFRFTYQAACSTSPTSAVSTSEREPRSPFSQPYSSCSPPIPLITTVNFQLLTQKTLSPSQELLTSCIHLCVTHLPSALALCWKYIESLTPPLHCHGCPLPTVTIAPWVVFPTTHLPPYTLFSTQQPVHAVRWYQHPMLLYDLPQSKIENVHNCLPGFMWAAPPTGYLILSLILLLIFFCAGPTGSLLCLQHIKHAQCPGVCTVFPLPEGELCPRHPLG